VFAPRFVGRNMWRAVAVIMPVGGTPIIAVKASPVGPKTDEICERDIGVVPHDKR